MCTSCDICTLAQLISCYGSVTITSVTVLKYERITRYCTILYCTIALHRFRLLNFKYYTDDYSLKNRYGKKRCKPNSGKRANQKPISNNKLIKITKKI